MNIFVETALCCQDNDQNYALKNFQMYRNDFDSEKSVRSSYGTVVYISNGLQGASNPLRCSYN